MNVYDILNETTRTLTKLIRNHPDRREGCVKDFCGQPIWVTLPMIMPLPSNRILTEVRYIEGNIFYNTLDEPNQWFKPATLPDMLAIVEKLTA